MTMEMPIALILLVIFFCFIFYQNHKEYKYGIRNNFILTSDVNYNLDKIINNENCNENEIIEEIKNDIKKFDETRVY